jgi:hypothetical protein
MKGRIAKSTASAKGFLRPIWAAGAARYLENSSVAAETFGMLSVPPGRCDNSEVQGIVSNSLTLNTTRRSKPHAEKCR